MGKLKRILVGAMAIAILARHALLMQLRKRRRRMAAAKGLSSPPRLVPSPSKKQAAANVSNHQAVADLQDDQQSDSVSDTSSRGSEQGEALSEASSTADPAYQEGPGTPQVLEPATRATVRLGLEEHAIEDSPGVDASAKPQEELSQSGPVTRKQADIEDQQMDAQLPAAHQALDSGEDQSESEESMQEGVTVSVKLCAKSKGDPLPEAEETAGVASSVKLNTAHVRSSTMETATESQGGIAEKETMTNSVAQYSRQAALFHTFIQRVESKEERAKKPAVSLQAAKSPRISKTIAKAVIARKADMADKEAQLNLVTEPPGQTESRMQGSQRQACKDASSNVADIPRLPAVAKAASVAASKPTGSRGKLLEHALERQRKLTAQAAVVQQKRLTASSSAAPCHAAKRSDAGAHGTAVAQPVERPVPERSKPKAAQTSKRPVVQPIGRLFQKASKAAVNSTAARACTSASIMEADTPSTTAQPRPPAVKSDHAAQDSPLGTLLVKSDSTEAAATLRHAAFASLKDIARLASSESSAPEISGSRGFTALAKPAMGQAQQDSFVGYPRQAAKVKGAEKDKACRKQKAAVISPGLAFPLARPEMAVKCMRQCPAPVRQAEEADGRCLAPAQQSLHLSNVLCYPALGKPVVAAEACGPVARITESNGTGNGKFPASVQPAVQMISAQSPLGLARQPVKAITAPNQNTVMGRAEATETHGAKRLDTHVQPAPRLNSIGSFAPIVRPTDETKPAAQRGGTARFPLSESSSKADGPVRFAAQSRRGVPKDVSATSPPLARRGIGKGGTGVFYTPGHQAPPNTAVARVSADLPARPPLAPPAKPPLALAPRPPPPPPRAAAALPPQAVMGNTCRPAPAPASRAAPEPPQAAYPDSPPKLLAAPATAAPNPGAELRASPDRRPALSPSRVCAPAAKRNQPKATQSELIGLEIPGIYLGGSRAPSDLQFLKHKGITLVVSCHGELISKNDQKHVSSLVFDLKGCRVEDILLCLTHTFYVSVECAWKKGGKVLVVHDNDSVIFVLAMLIYIFRLSLEEALSRIQPLQANISCSVHNKLKQWAEDLENPDMERRFVMQPYQAGWIPVWNDRAPKIDRSVILQQSGKSQVIWPGRGNEEALQAALEWADIFACNEGKDKATLVVNKPPKPYEVVIGKHPSWVPEAAWKARTREQNGNDK